MTRRGSRYLESDLHARLSQQLTHSTRKRRPTDTLTNRKDDIRPIKKAGVLLGSRRPTRLSAKHKAADPGFARAGDAAAIGWLLWFRQLALVPVHALD